MSIYTWKIFYLRPWLMLLLQAFSIPQPACTSQKILCWFLTYWGSQTQPGNLFLRWVASPPAAAVRHFALSHVLSPSLELLPMRFTWNPGCVKAHYPSPSAQVWLCSALSSALFVQVLVWHRYYAEKYEKMQHLLRIKSIYRYHYISTAYFCVMLKFKLGFEFVQDALRVQHWCTSLDNTTFCSWSDAQCSHRPQKSR